MQLVFATNNINKFEEIKRLIAKPFTLLSLNDIGCFEDIPETQNTIEANAIQKAKYVTQSYGYNCFADDTGLEVNALNGKPGVLSARYAGKQRNTHDNMDKLLLELKNKTNRKAQFKTVIALCFNQTITTFTGICKGEITKVKHGNKGFGYDPIFKPEHYNQTFAQLSINQKNNIGHRGKAIKKLVHYLNYEITK